jgi:hypothetical protein
VNPFIALTDKAWFDCLSSRGQDGIVDEVNFWSPKSQQPLKRMAAEDAQMDQSGRLPRQQFWNWDTLPSAELGEAKGRQCRRAGTANGPRLP